MSEPDTVKITGVGLAFVAVADTGKPVGEATGSSKPVVEHASISGSSAASINLRVICFLGSERHGSTVQSVVTPGSIEI